MKGTMKGRGMGGRYRRCREGQGDGMRNSLPFKGREGVGMGYLDLCVCPHHPIPHPASPLKGEEHD